MTDKTDRDATPATLQRAWLAGDAGLTNTDGDTSKSPSALYRELRFQGFAPDEAGNLAAYLSGIRPVEGGWNPREIERLLFMRHLVQRGRRAG